MDARACVVLLLAAAAAARDCIELTLPPKSLLTESILNGTIFRLTARNESIERYPQVNIMNLFNRFPKVVVPRNGTNEQCRIDSQMFLDGLDNLELWALKSNIFVYFREKCMRVF